MENKTLDTSSLAKKTYYDNTEIEKNIPDVTGLVKQLVMIQNLLILVIE